MKFIEWLNQFEEELLNLNEISVIDDEKTSKKEEKPERFDQNISAAGYYLKNAIQAYYTIIQRLKLIANDKKQLLSLLKNKGSASKAFRARMSQELNKIDSVRFVPHIFHPYYDDVQNQYFLRPDENCYFLASIVKNAMERLQEVDDDFLEVMKYFPGHKLAKIIYTLNNRIERYEHNRKFNDKITQYEQKILPRFAAIADDLDACDRRFNEKSVNDALDKILEILWEIQDFPIVATEFLRDDSLLMLRKAKAKDYYTEQLNDFFSGKRTDDLTTPYRAKEKYDVAPDARNVRFALDIAEAIEKSMGFLENDAFKFLEGNQQFIAIKILIACLKGEDNTALTQLSSEKVQEAWVKEIYNSTETLLNTFTSFKSSKTSKKKPRKRIGKEVFDNLTPLLQAIKGYETLDLWAQEMVLSALVSKLTSLAKTYEKVYVDSKLGKKSEFEVLTSFHERIEKCSSLDSYVSYIGLSSV